MRDSGWPCRARGSVEAAVRSATLPAVGFREGCLSATEEPAHSLTAAPPSRRGRLAGSNELGGAVLRPRLRTGRDPVVLGADRGPDGDGRRQDAVSAPG